MHLAENYALSAGVKIGTPKIETSFFPIGFEKYITIQSGSGMPSKNYSYLNDVVSTVYPQLKKRGIEILQIGLEKEKRVVDTIDLRGKTSIRQCAHLIKNSMLHVGNDSFACHLAGGFNVPLVALYGVTFPECSAPFWGDKEKQIILAPDFSIKKPSFSMKESPKRVNSIFPDKVAHGILKLLELDASKSETEPVHLGESFYRTIVDIVPNFETEINTFGVKKGSSINLRLDYLNGCDYKSVWAKNFTCVMHVNKRDHIEIIERDKKSISKLYVYLTQEFTEDDLKKLLGLAKPMSLYYSDKDTISEARIKFFGQNIYLNDSGSKKALDFPSKICDTSLYKSSLNLYSNNKLYGCKAAMDRGITKQKQQFTIDTPDFYKEAEFFKIYNYGQKKNI